MKKIIFLPIAIITALMFFACSKEEQHALTNYEELLIGQWIRSESSKSGGSKQLLTFYKDKSYEWVFYGYLNGPFGYKDTSKIYGNWRVFHDTLYCTRKDSLMFSPTEVELTPMTIDLLNTDSLYFTMYRLMPDSEKTKIKNVIYKWRKKL